LTVDAGRIEHTHEGPTGIAANSGRPVCRIPLLVKAEMPNALAIEGLLCTQLTCRALSIRDTGLAETRRMLRLGGAACVREAVADKILAAALAARGVIRSRALHAGA
jgi:hypothetical protein